MIRKTVVLLATAAAATLLSATPAHAAPPAALVPATTAAQASGQLMLVSTTYTVGPDDTLAGIAARFCGHPSAAPAISTSATVTAGQRLPLVCQSYAHPPTIVTTTKARPEPVKPKAPATARTVSVGAPVPASGRGAAIVAFALAQLGKPYVWAATGPNSFDCSGLVVAAYRSIGMTVPHYTGDLLGQGHAISRADLQPGDLVFPSSGHVMIYIGDGRVVHAPHTGANVQIGTIYAFYAARRI